MYTFLSLWMLLAFVVFGQYYPLEYKGMTITNGKYCPNITYDSNVTRVALKHIASMAVNTLSIVVTQYQTYHNSTWIHPLYNASVIHTPKYTFVTATDNALRSVISEAHELGMRVMLKPQIDLTNDTKGIWRADIGIGFNESMWDQWFANYTAFILHYATIATEMNVEILSVSCELSTPAMQTGHWRALIPQIRGVYHGLLTSSANWSPPNASGEVTDTQWWDLMDFIGCDQYYHGITDNPYPTLNQLIQSWQPIVAQLGALSKKWNKSVAFTETGWASSPYGVWTGSHVANQSDLETQALRYEAILEAFASQPWFLGVFWWNFPTDASVGGQLDSCATPSYKPAESVLRKWYNATLPIPPAPKAPPLCHCTE